MDVAEVLSGGEDPSLADEPVDLERERVECREEDEPQATEKKPPRPEVGRGWIVLASEQSFDAHGSCERESRCKMVCPSGARGSRPQHESSHRRSPIHDTHSPRVAAVRAVRIRA